MGSVIKVNDTLNLTIEQGFPAHILDIEKHRASPITLDEVQRSIFTFQKPRARLYPSATTRCFLVQNIGDKWLFWGKVRIIEQTIKGRVREEQTTSGKFEIIQIYSPDYQREVSRNEAPEGLSYL